MITLATLSKATAQQVFEQIRDHLLEQGEKCGTVRQCFLHYNGLKCAAGCLVSPEEHAAASQHYPEFNKVPWSRLVSEDRVPIAHQDQIGALQLVHDKNDPDNWPVLLEQFPHAYPHLFNQ